jgi:photosystem II stability/assembly factor-like uncharacterized protein
MTLRSPLLYAAIACMLAFAVARSAALAGEPGDVSALEWRSIGPAIPSGRMTAVAGSDRDPSTYYAGSAGGGVFKTVNAGTTWTPVFDHEAVAAIGAIAVDPRDPNVVWVGTGEGNPRNDASYGNGIYLSRDGGKTWHYRGLAGSEQITRIVIDPRDSKIVLVGVLGNTFADSALRGVYRTADGGATWQRTLFTGPASGAADLAIDSHDPRTVFAGMWQFRRTPWRFDSGGPAGGLYRSRDNGRTWLRVRGRGFPGGVTGRIGVAFAPSDHRRIYAVVESRLGRLWRSDDGGVSWLRASDQLIVDDRPWYFSHVAVDPHDRDRVLALSAYMAESTDGGRRFRSQERIAHLDNHDLWWAADGRRVILAHDGGISLSSDAGRSWAWSANLPTEQVYHLGFDHETPYRVCLGIQDTNTWCGPSNALDPTGIANEDWFKLNTSDGSSAWFDPLDPALIYDAPAVGDLAVFNTRTLQRYSITPAPELYVDPYAIQRVKVRFGWSPRIALDPLDPHALYFGGNVLFKTRDRGRTWSIVSPDLTLNDKLHQAVSGGPLSRDASGTEYTDTILDIAPSPVRAGVVWVGTDDGLIQVTTDGGTSWQNVTPSGLPPFGRVTAIAPSFADPAAAFAVVDRHFSGDRAAYVFGTSNYGRTWRRLTRGLPAGQIARVVRTDPYDPQLLFLGLEQGVRISYDAGASWRSLQRNLPTSAVYDLQLQPETHDLIAGTHGRGVWILPDLTALESRDAAPAEDPILFAPLPAHTFWLGQRRYGQWNYDDTPDAPVNVFTAPNPPYGALLTYRLPAPARRPPRLVILDGNGNTVRTLPATNRAGLNRMTWNLSEEPAVPYLAAVANDRAESTDGPQVVPARYRVRLEYGDRAREVALDVRPDPRASWSTDDYARAHAFSASLFRDLSALNATLNRLDAALRAPARLRTPTFAAFRARVAALERRITFHRSEDQLFYLHTPAGTREKIIGLFGVVAGNSQGPPLPPHEALRDALHREVLDEVRDAARLLDEDAKP